MDADAIAAIQLAQDRLAVYAASVDAAMSGIPTCWLVSPF